MMMNLWVRSEGWRSKWISNRGAIIYVNIISQIQVKDIAKLHWEESKWFYGRKINSFFSSLCNALFHVFSWVWCSALSCKKILFSCTHISSCILYMYKHAYVLQNWSMKYKLGNTVVLKKSLLPSLHSSCVHLYCMFTFNKSWFMNHHRVAAFRCTKLHILLGKK